MSRAWSYRHSAKFVECHPRPNVFDAVLQSLNSRINERGGRGFVELCHLQMTDSQQFASRAGGVVVLCKVNNTGPKMEPWGTLHTKSAQLEKQLSTETACDMSERYEQNQDNEPEIQSSVNERM